MDERIPMMREVTELAFRLADCYISIQEASEGYDYTIYDMNYRELDGGVYDDPNMTIYEALDEILLDLKESMHRGEWKGSVHGQDELMPIDYDNLIEKAEYVEKLRIEEQIKKIIF